VSGIWWHVSIVHEANTITTAFSFYPTPPGKSDPVDNVRNIVRVVSPTDVIECAAVTPDAQKGPFP